MKSTCSTTLRRTLGVAGFLIGFGLLSAGVASADEGDPPGLLDGVVTLVAPVTEPVLAPTVDTAVHALSPVLEPLQPVTAPVLAPVARTVPVVPRVVEPPVVQPPDQAEVPPPVAAQPVPEINTAALSDRVAPATTPRQQQMYAPDVAPPIEAPSQPSPDVPLALPGTTGSASSSGSTGLVLSDLPAESGVRPSSESLVVVTDHQVHGSWCYYYGRNHPS
ncbi:hypothetical protein SAMN04488074_110301 [Lentzea albidocapillata subsp. violacea]|uniref:Uncharacterized protein n=1 Tax=Lentzea albidocapillata subsp. violacea TaxID=128104 RepID=A0A1G9JMY7_9PSEU|nr:hypothetical protein [Lentzea albidocapillata]SDL38646.1 hypothetical protein SAMN04488074_110301 [Lentzea albidocapillata subsp. violacea]